MADRIGELVAQVVADTAQFRTEMRALAQQVSSNVGQINRQLSTIGKASAGLQSSFRLLTRAAALFGVALSARAVINFVQSTVQAAKELKNLSERLNISVEALSELQYVAKITDVDFGRLTQSVQFMVRQLAEAERGSKGARDTFKTLGVDFRALAALPVDQQLAAMADGLANVTSHTQRLSLAQRVFGRGSAEMLQLVNRGAEGINQLTREARQLGITLSADAAKKAADFSDELDRMTSAFQAMTREAILRFGPTITNVLSKVTEQLRTDAAAEGLRQIETAMRRQQRAVDEARSAYDRFANLVVSQDFSQPMLPDEITRRLRELNTELKKAEETMIALKFTHKTMLAGQAAGGGGGGGGGAAEDPFAKQMAAAMDAIRASRGTMGRTLTGQDVAATPELLRVQEAHAENERLMTQITVDELKARHAAVKKFNEDRIELEKFAASSVASFQEGAIDSGIGLLRTLGAEHRGAAIAAIAIEKALMVQRILVQGRAAAAQILALGQVAAWQAMAQLGPAGAGVAASIKAKSVADAARVKVMSTVAAVFTGLEGAAQISQLSSNGVDATRGTSANPLITAPASSVPGAVAGITPRQRGVQIIFQGDVFGWDETMRRKVVESLRDLIDNKDVVIFGPNSRQAIEILGG